MANLGAHMSIAGGLPNALLRGRDVGCSVVQLFLKNQVQWVGRPLHADEVAEFKRQQAATGIGPVFAHATYLINLAAPGEAEWLRSVSAFAEELERAERLGLPFVVIHPGSHMGAGRARGVARVVRALDDLVARTAGYRVRIVLENTTGGGGLLGARAEEMGTLVGRVRRPERIGVCLDTCHLFAAGYDVRTRAGVADALARFDRAVGLERLVAFHLNDAKAGLGSGLDRHEHIGRGQIGLPAFRFLLAHPRLRTVPMVLETPKEERRPDGQQAGRSASRPRRTGAGEGYWDRRNLATLRGLRRRRTGGAAQRDVPRNRSTQRRVASR